MYKFIFNNNLLVFKLNYKKMCIYNIIKVLYIKVIFGIFLVFCQQITMKVHISNTNNYIQFNKLEAIFISSLS